MNQMPVAIGLLVCETVIVDQQTKNVTPVNCFTRREFDEFPSEPMTLHIVAFLTNGLGAMNLDAVVESLDNWDEIRRMSMQARFVNPLQEFRCVFRMRGFSIPQPGHYQVSLVADGETVAQRKIVFTEKKI